MDREERAKKRRKSRIIKSVFWVAVLGIAAWFFLFGNDVISFSGIKHYFSELFTSESTPVAELNGTAVESVCVLGSDMAVLSDIGVQVISKSGSEKLSVQHGCADPAMDSCGGRFIVFDKGGTRYEIYNRHALEREGVTEYEIIDASIASDGSCVLVTGSKSYHNEVHYYNAKGEKKYSWYSADNYVYNVELKDNAKSFSALGMVSESGNIESTLLIFDPSSKDEPIKTKLSGNIFYSVSYKGSNVCIIGEDELITLSSKGEVKNTYSYGEKALRGYANTSSGTVLVFSKYGVGRDHVLTMMDSGGKEKNSTELQVDFKGVSVCGKNITVLGSHDVYTYSTGLSLKNASEISADGVYACTVGKNVYVYGVGSIIKLTY